jgi:hypothetical protein
METAANANNSILTRSQILTIAERYNNPEIGEGVRALVATTPELVSTQAVFRVITQSALVPEIDLLARRAQPLQIAASASAVPAPAAVTSLSRVATPVLSRPASPIFRPFDPILRPIRPDLPIFTPLDPTKPRLTLASLGSSLLELARADNVDELRQYVLEQLRSLL